MGRHWSRDLTHIDQLNRHLGDALGRLPDGRPRFSWMKAHEARYFVVIKGEVRVTDWSKRLGDVWVLCGWSEPTMFDPASRMQKPITREQWTKMCGAAPYPTKGMWRAYPETAVPESRMPTQALTANYCKVIDGQLSCGFFDKLNEIDVGLALDKEQEYAEWTEYVQNSNPAFSNFEPGARGGHVSLPAVT